MQLIKMQKYMVVGGEPVKIIAGVHHERKNGGMK